MMTHYLQSLSNQSEPNIEGVLAAIGLSPHLASRIARTKEDPSTEISRHTIKSETVKESPLPQKVADDNERVVKNEEVYKDMPGDDNWYDDDGRKYIIDGSGDCFDDDYCEPINYDDGQKCNDYDSRTCDNASRVNDDNDSANPPQMNVAEEVESCKIKSEIVEECVHMKVSSKTSSFASGANVREIIVIDDDDDSEDEEVLPIKDSARTDCRKRNRKEFQIITKDHDIYNIDDDDDDDEEGESESDDDDDIHAMVQITHTASSSDVKRHRGIGSTSSSRTALSIKAKTSVTGSSSKTATSCVTVAAIEQHVLHDTPLMTITRYPIKEQEPFHLCSVTNEEVNDCVPPRPLDIALDSILSESRNEAVSLEENHPLCNPPTMPFEESESQARYAVSESNNVDTHLHDSLGHANGVTAAQSLQKLSQDNEPKNTFFGKAIMEFSMRQYDTINRMINGH